MALDATVLSEIRASLDPGAYKTGADAVADSNEKLVRTGEQVVATQEKVTRSVIDGGKGYDSLKQRLDPAYRAAVEYQKALAAIDQAEALGHGTAAEHAQMIATVTERYHAATAAHEGFRLKAGESLFIMRQSTLAAVGLGTAIAQGEPIMTALTTEVVRLGTEMTISRHGFHIWREAIGEMWSEGKLGAVALVAAILAAVAALAYMGATAEETNRKIAGIGTFVNATHPQGSNVRPEDVEAAAQNFSRTTPGLGQEQALESAQAIARVAQFGGNAADLRTDLNLIKDLGSVLIDTAKGADEVTKAGTEMVVKAFEDPAKAAQELSDKHLGGLNQTLAETIKKMQDTGDKAGATTKLFTILGENLSPANLHLTPLQQTLQTINELLFGTEKASGTLSENLGELTVKFINIEAKGIAVVIRGFQNLKGYITDMATAIEDFMNRPSVRDFFSGKNAGPQIPRSMSPTNMPTTDGYGPDGMPLPVTSNPNAGPRVLTQIASQLIDQIGAQLGMRPELVAFSKNIASVESGGNQYNPDGSVKYGPQTKYGRAVGTMQVMPFNAEGADLTDRTQNITRGLQMLQDLDKKYFGDLTKVAIGYNAGEGAIGRRGGIPNETVDYLNKLGQPQPRLPGPRISNLPEGAAPEVSNVIEVADYKTVEENYKKHLDTLKAAREGFDLDMGKAERDAAQAQKDKDIALGKGQDNEAAAAQVRYDKAIETQQNIQVKLNNLKTDAVKSAEAAQRAADIAAVPAGMGRTEAQIRQRYEEMGKLTAAGTDVVSMNKEIAAAEAAAGSSFDQDTQKIERQAAGLRAQVLLVGQTSAVTDHMKNSVKAAQDALAVGVPGSAAYEAALKSRTKALDDVSAAERDAALAKNLTKYDNEIDALKLEQSLLTSSVDEREKELTVLKERQALLIPRDATVVPGSVASTIINNAVLAEELKKSISLSKAATDQIRGSVESGLSSITDTFIASTHGAVDWGQTLSNVADQVLKAFLQLAVINPIMNSIFSSSTQQPTTGWLGTLLKLGGSYLSGGASGLGTAAGAAVIDNPFGGMTAHGGGIVSDRAVNSVFPASWFNGAPRYASGLGPNEMAAILHKGEWVLNGDQQNKMMAAASGSSSVVVNTPITINGSGGGSGKSGMDPAAVKQLQATIDKTVRTAVRSVIVDQKRPGGDLY